MTEKRGHTEQRGKEGVVARIGFPSLSMYLDRVHLVAKGVRDLVGECGVQEGPVNGRAERNGEETKECYGERESRHASGGQLPQECRIKHLIRFRGFLEG